MAGAATLGSSAEAPAATMDPQRQARASHVVKLLESKGKRVADEIQRRIERGEGITAKGQFFPVQLLEEALTTWRKQQEHVETRMSASVNVTASSEVAPSHAATVTATVTTPTSARKRKESRTLLQENLDEPQLSSVRSKMPRISAEANVAGRASAPPASAAPTTAMRAADMKAKPANAVDQANGIGLLKRVPSSEAQSSTSPAKGGDSGSDVVRNQQANDLQTQSSRRHVPSEPPPSTTARSPSKELGTPRPPQQPPTAPVRSPGSVKELKRRLAAHGIDFSRCEGKADLESLWGHFEQLCRRDIGELRAWCRTAGKCQDASSASAEDCAKLILASTPSGVKRQAWLLARKPETLTSSGVSKKSQLSEPTPPTSSPTSAPTQLLGGVKDLKLALAAKGVDFSHCVEKHDLESLWTRFEELCGRDVEELRAMCVAAGVGEEVSSASVEDCAKLLIAPPSAVPKLEASASFPSAPKQKHSSPPSTAPTPSRATPQTGPPTAVPTQMSVGELKTALAAKGVDCSGCVEKSDLEALWKRFEELCGRGVAELRAECVAAGLAEDVRCASAEDCARKLLGPSQPIPRSGSGGLVRQQSAVLADEASLEVKRIMSQRKQSFRSDVGWGFAVLGCLKGSQDEASVQRQYRTMMKKLHPDRVGHMEEATRAVEVIREAKELCLRSLSRQKIPPPPKDLRYEVVDDRSGFRRIRLEWSSPPPRDDAPVRRYVVAAHDPSYGRALTVTILEPDYSEELRRYVSMEELCWYELAEEELRKMPSLFRQEKALLQVAASNEAGQSEWSQISLPLKAKVGASGGAAYTQGNLRSVGKVSCGIQASSLSKSGQGNVKRRKA